MPTREHILRLPEVKDARGGERVHVCTLLTRAAVRWLSLLFPAGNQSKFWMKPLPIS